MRLLRVGLSAWIALLAWTAMESQAEEPGIVLPYLPGRTPWSEIPMGSRSSRGARWL